MKRDYDVVIAGGGMAGLITAASVGHHTKGKARVLVIDRNSREDAGRKTVNGWTCGDATSKRSLDFLAEHIGIRYGSPELEHPVKGVLVYSPDHKTKVLFEGEGYLFNRRLAPQRQVRDAEKFGVEFMFSATAERLLSDDGRVTGVEGRRRGGTPFKVTAKVVIDASGSSSVLRKFLPIKSNIEKEIDLDDVEATGRYIYEFDQGVEDETYFTPDYCLIHLDQYKAPAGYCVAADTPIICKNSVKTVQEVKLGDEVLTSSGWMPVSGTSERNFNGDLVVLTPFMLNQSIGLTPEHKVRVWNPKTGETWKRADELIRSTRGSHRKGDYLVVPLPPANNAPLEEIDTRQYVSGIEEDGYVYVTIKRSFFNGRAPDGSHQRKVTLAKHPKRTRFPIRLALSPDFLQLCGWYVSEGCVKKNHAIISNSNLLLIERIHGLISRLGFHSFDSVSKRKDREKPTINVEISNSLLARFLESCFGRGARKKKLPSWIHEISRDSKLAFLRGFYLGDGSMDRSTRGRPDSRTFTTTARALLLDMWILLAGIGVVGGIKRNKKKNAWSMGVFGHQARFLGENLTIASRNQQGGFVLGDERVYLGIRKIHRKGYSGAVYDLNSAGDFTPLFNVHNCWVFPKGENKVNIGLGVSKSGLDRRNRRFKLNDNLQTLIDQYVRENPAIRNPRPPAGDADLGNTKGNWQVPVRRHNDCLVANGFAIVGDAAWMPRPIDAGGISPSIYGATILGKVVADALEADDFSERFLWRYNTEYMQTHGYPMASFEVLRRYLQTITNEQLNYGMKHFLSEDDISNIIDRKHPDFNKVQYINPIMWFRILNEFELARGLRYTVKKSAALVEHNLAYPESPDGFGSWKTKLERELVETIEKFKPIGAVQ
ncbi:MAG: FAD-dependent monooxygenase [Thaumarchaeota archaeon]|nr:FAD-dependent monooxygenase [Nitrososphaerota archaeon]